MELSQRRHALGGGDAADLRHLGLEVGDRLGPQQALEVFERSFSPAANARPGRRAMTLTEFKHARNDARVAVHALHRAVIAHRPGRLLEPRHAEVRELAAEGDSLDRVEVTVDVDHDRQFVAEAAAQALDVVDRLVQLDRADASINGALGFVDDKLADEEFSSRRSYQWD